MRESFTETKLRGEFQVGSELCVGRIVIATSIQHIVGMYRQGKVEIACQCSIIAHKSFLSKICNGHLKDYGFSICYRYSSCVAHLVRNRTHTTSGKLASFDTMFGI